MKYFVRNKLSSEIKVCNSENELISCFASYNYRTRNGKRNFLLERISMNDNDKRLKFDLNTANNILVPREYIVYDELNRVVDPRFFKDEIINFKVDKSKIKSFYSEFSDRSIQRDKVLAIPRCGNKSGRYFRCPRTTQERRHNAIVEYMIYVRGRRSVPNLSNAWDDMPVHREKSWKRNKIKRQYMKNSL